MQMDIGSKKSRMVSYINTINDTLKELEKESIKNVNQSMNNSIQSLILINMISIMKIILLITLYKEDIQNQKSLLKMKLYYYKPKITFIIRCEKDAIDSP